MQTALVIGLGKSGKGAVRFLRHLGYHVCGVDREKKDDLEIEVFHEEKLPEELTFDLVVLSPGVSPNHPLCTRGKEVIGEVELGARHLKNQCIGVTGTNGKTTLVLFLTHALRILGKKVRALGNVGESLADYMCAPDEEEIIVLELSSFQLETMRAPILDLAIITTITPDHLDRYPSFEVYAKTKYHIKDLLKPLQKDSYLQLTENEGYCEFAAKALLPWGATREKVRFAMESFDKPPHRLEKVAEIGEVLFCNDSKGTNPEAVIFATHAQKRPIILLAGGRNKGGSFRKWKEAFKGKVKEVIVYGEAAEEIVEELEKDFPLTQVETLREGVQAAWERARGGEVILLSPGCASFDQFKNFEERGDLFKECVEELRKIR